MKRHQKHLRFTRTALAVAAALAALFFLHRRTILLPPTRPPAPHVARAHGAVLDYTIYAAGFKALDAALKENITPRTYEIDIKAETKGFLGRLFPWETSAETTGRRMAGGSFIPAKHSETSLWKKHLYKMDLGYDDTGAADNMALFTDGKKVFSAPLDAAQATGAGDILTAALTLLQGAAAHEAKDCTGSYAVYDGRRRYNVTLTDAGEDILAPSRYSVFSGKARRCTLSLVPVAGFNAADKKRGWWAIQNYTEARHKPPTIWIADMKAGAAEREREKSGAGMSTGADTGTDMGIGVIVRMEIDSAYGAAVANLAGKHVY